MRYRYLFADDISIRAQEEINCKTTLESFDDILKSNYEMKINKKKTEVTVCCNDPENIDTKMDDSIKNVPKFKYRGSTYIYSSTYI